MIFTPTRIDYPEIADITQLSWPKDKWRIALMSQANKEIWYASREPIGLIYQSYEFAKFWERCYLKPLKIKRFIYKFKFW